MTDRIYNTDCLVSQFEAKVISCTSCEKGYAIVLDKTAFFPGGGGQPRDYGTLEGVEVEDLIEKEDELYHIISRPFEEGQTVFCKVDFERRMDLMQQHSGEHLIAGVIDQEYGYQNVGFHLSEETVTADFDGVLTEEELLHVERLANQAVIQDARVLSENLAQEQARDRVFRSKKTFDGEIRIVTMGAYDSCACCGVHVQRTGQIGLIKIVDAQKHRGGMRLTLKCGLRALKDYQIKTKQSTAISSLLSVKLDEAVIGVQKLIDEKNLLRQKLYEVREQYFELKAEQCSSEAPICLLEEDLSPDEMKRFVNKIMTKTPYPVLVLTPETEGFKYALGKRDTLVQTVCKALNESFSGKGGGREICQGSLKGDAQSIFEKFKVLCKTYCE